jgi:hypothetical protein
MILMRLIIDCARGAPLQEVLFIITSALRSHDPGSYSVLQCSTNFIFVCKKLDVSSVFSELNSPVGTYVVSNLAQSDILKSHLSFDKANNFDGVKCYTLRTYCGLLKKCSPCCILCILSSS